VAGFAVLAWVQKIKHGYPNHITEAFTVRVKHFPVSVGIMGEGEWHGFDVLWSGVFIEVGFEEVGEAGVHGAVCSESGIRGPQFGECLCDVKDFIANMCMSDGPATTGKGARAESLGKTPKDFDFVADTTEERVGDSEVRKEQDPALNPNGVGCMGSVCGDTGSGRLVDKAEITHESISGGTCCICQEDVCGKRALNREISCESVKSKRWDGMSASTLEVPWM
jgi:hypothetical protein